MLRDTSRLMYHSLNLLIQTHLFLLIYFIEHWQNKIFIQCNKNIAGCLYLYNFLNIIDITKKINMTEWIDIPSVFRDLPLSS